MKYLKELDAEIAKQMGITMKEYKYISKDEWWLTATEAASYGVVDGVLTNLLYDIYEQQQQQPFFQFFDGFEGNGGIIINPLR